MADEPEKIDDEQEAPADVESSDAEETNVAQDAENAEETAAESGADQGAELTEAQKVAANVAVARPKKKTAAKGKPTNKRKGEAKAEKKERTSPVEFVKQCIAELKKVVWPTLQQWNLYFIVVLVFVLVVIAYVSGLDAGFGSLMLWLFGGN
ncbi:MAG: preprotein translocase subunit SecE [Propionibacteriaceae bacterium]|jgi:preprotein translocase subunit SecE|nr:preprotein translocase subunit SecE [Propionibacteriaceae bacterium]